MKNVLILFSLLCTMQATSLFAQPAPKAVLTAVGAAISWDRTSAELGEIPQNKPAEVTFVLTNDGDAPLIVERVKATCGCTVTGHSEEPVLPGENTVITATYNAKKLGPFKKVVKVYTTLSKEPIPLTIKGTVTEVKL